MYNDQTTTTHQKSHTANSSSYPKPDADDYQQISEKQHIFFQKLQAFHTSFGTKFKVPTIGGRDLDLHRLFVEVTSRGGIEKVIKDRKWKEIITVFNFPSTTTNASFVLRKYYLSLLYHFEQVYFFGKTVPSTDSVSRSVIGTQALHVLENGATISQFSESRILEPGSLVNGTIDAKFDNGYLISVDLGSEKLMGVLYHPPKAKAFVPWGR